VAALAFAAAGCGDEASTSPAAPPTGTPPAGAYLFAQEIWIAYARPDPRGERPLGRTPAEARELSDRLRLRVEGGADVGALAREHSNGPGAPVDGFAMLDGQGPDPRYDALRAVADGALTPTIEVQGGFWFARRLTLERGLALLARYEKEGTRARAQAIAFAFKGMVPFRYDVKHSKADAIASAEARLRELLDGADFSALARRWSNDVYSAPNGGVIQLPRPGRWSPWITPFDANQVSPELLEVIFKAEVGQLWPHVIVTARAIMLVKVLERHGPR
jgi:hypothetical protein